MLNPKGIFLDSNHSFKMGDSMIRTYGKKAIKFEFNFDDDCKELRLGFAVFAMLFLVESFGSGF